VIPCVAGCLTSCGAKSRFQNHGTAACLRRLTLRPVG